MKSSFASVGLITVALLSTAPRIYAAEPADTPLPAALKECLGKKTESNECLELLFREALQAKAPAQLLGLVQKYEDSDPALKLSCHPVVHALGREIFRIKGNIHDSFLACDQTCHSGCYHGAVERFLRGDAQGGRHVTQSEIMSKAAAACDAKAPQRVYFQCLHGLGHALMYFTENQLDKSLQGCDSLPDGWSRESCYGGVFMENVFSSNPEIRNVSATDYHHPCNQIDAKYRGACYLMQTWRMEEMGLTTERLFEECAKAGPFATQCALSIGRDLSNIARGGANRPAAEKCERGQGESRRACIRGVVYALIDNTWDNSYAAPFCSALRDEDVTYCNLESSYYLKTFVGK
ncbi:MAG TPA: hypothetical protein VGL11_07370 [Candidatus Binatia bacterium]|jgi:hypothetical protein